MHGRPTCHACCATQVRLAFLGMLGDWLTRLPERNDHQPRLLPYVLSALCDESHTVVEAALKLLDQLGSQYEAEHEKGVREAVEYLPPEAHGVGWADALPRAVRYALPGPCTGGGGAAEGGGSGSSDSGGGSSNGGDSGDDGSNGGAPIGPSPLQLPGPWPCRPRLGVRLLLQSQFARLVPALAAELGCWQGDVQLRAARLLAVCLVAEEDAAVDQLAALVPPLCRVRDGVGRAAMPLEPAVVLARMGAAGCLTCSAVTRLVMVAPCAGTTILAGAVPV